MTNVSGTPVCPIFRVLGNRRPKTQKMEQTSSPETLVIHQKLTPGNNTKNFKQPKRDVQYFSYSKIY
jgi:hypothetical protein